MDEHGHIEATKDQIGLPLDIDKRRRHEIAKREVENPVRSCREGDGLATDAQREELRGIDPRDLFQSANVVLKPREIHIPDPMLVQKTQQRGR